MTRTDNLSTRGWQAFAVIVASLVFSSGPVLASPVAAPAPVNADVTYIFNTLLFLIGGFLVMWMAAGFAMLEVGFVRSRHASTICLKNIGLYAIAGIVFFLVGYNLMYANVGDHLGLIGTPSIWSASELYGDEVIDATANGYASTSDWFFQMVFVATTASIVSGAVAERVRIGPFFIFVAILAAFIYPIQGAWHWGEGWLYQLGFQDFAGSTLVHSVGGWAALMGVILIGARDGRFVDGKSVAMHGSSMPTATLGTFILWLGWFGFNGGSQLALGTVSDATAIAQIFANTNMAAAAGVVTAYLLSMGLGHGRANLGYTLNGALAGLVAITADPLHPTIGQALFIGAIGAVIATFGARALEKLRIDDVVGAIPVHLFAGIWGTLAVVISNPDANLFAQLVGILAIGAFVSVASLGVWTVLKLGLGIRLSPHEQAVGGDMTELDQAAYPDFVTHPAPATSSPTPPPGAASATTSPAE